MRFFKKTEKTLIRRVSDRVNNSMSVADCYSFIMGAMRAELDLHYLPGELSFKDKEKKERDDAYTESYYKPILCLLYTSPSPRDLSTSRMPSSA